MKATEFREGVIERAKALQRTIAVPEALRLKATKKSFYILYAVWKGSNI